MKTLPHTSLSAPTNDVLRELCVEAVGLGLQDVLIQVGRGAHGRTRMRLRAGTGPRGEVVCTDDPGNAVVSFQVDQVLTFLDGEFYL